MVMLVDAADVDLRLSGIQGFRKPSTLDDAAIESYIEGSSSIILQKAGFSSVPADGTISRSVLNDLAIRLTVLTITGDLFGNNPELREANRRERNDLLAEAKALADEPAEDGGTGGNAPGSFFDVVNLGY